MFDDEDRVALVPQLLQQFVEPVYVTRVQPDAGLIEDVHDIDQAAADVLDHLYPLRLAAGERIRGPVKAEVLQADVDHVLQALDEHRHHGRRHRIAPDALYQGDEFADLHGGQLGEVAAVDAAG